MKKNILTSSIFMSALLLTSCVAKKELDDCRTQNKSLIENYQTTKEELAASKARIVSLEEQLAQQKKDYVMLQQSLDKSLTNTGTNNVNISKLVDQINESNQYIRHLVEVKTTRDSLNLVLTNKLTRSFIKDEMKEVDVKVL